jgi:hypothetical protein
MAHANVLVLCVRRQNKRENEAHLYVCFPPSCRRSESGGGRLKAAAAESSLFVSVQWPKWAGSGMSGFGAR